MKKGGGPGGGGTVASESGLPCEVVAVLEAHCVNCHGPSVGTPPLLTTRAELMASAPSDPSRTVAGVSLDTMRGIGKPMPPGALLSEAVIAPFAEWLAQGMPAGNCAPQSGSSAGAGGSSVASTCTTNKYWLEGDKGSGQMHPGMPCVKCHVDENEAPIYVIAGTVYPTVREPDDCYGTLEDLLDTVVEITDANDVVHTIPIKSAGNFSKRADGTAIAFPVMARVVRGNDVVEMVAPIDEDGGDCNLCHTENGTEGAPGRILLPAP
jgi:hypothetical protein